MKLIDGVVVDQIGNDYVAVTTGDATKIFNGMIKLNKTAGFIVGEMMKETTIDTIVKSVLEKYDVDESTAREEVLHVVDELKHTGLVIDD